MTSYDAVVIGAGHNGLAAAVHLAIKGWKVVVVEAADVPGGAVKTLEVTLPGYRHDLYAMSMSLFASSGINREHGEALKQHGLEFVPMQDNFASVFPDNTYLGVTADVSATTEAIGVLSQKDAKAWSEMLKDFEHKAHYLFDVLGSPMPSWATAKALWQAWRAGGLPLVYDLIRLVVSSPSEFLDRHFENEKLKVMMAAWAAHLDFAPESSGGAMFPYIQSMASQFHPMLIGKGGADTIINAMVSLLKAKGGELILSTPVIEVLTDGEKAVGVRLRDGRTLKASRAVISNAHPKLLFGSLLRQPSKSERFNQAISTFRMGPGSMMIHLAVKELPVWSASKELSSFAYIHIAPDMNSINRTYQEATSGLIPAEPLLVVGQPTAADPSRAPEGRHVLWVQVRFMPFEISGDAGGTIRATDWDDAKEAMADRVIDIIERYAPGTKASILGRYVISPKDLERDNANLIDGDGISGSHHLDQNFVFRPVAGYSRYRTPVKNLFICGAATWPGAGVGAGSGYMLAKMLAR